MKDSRLNLSFIKEHLITSFAVTSPTVAFGNTGYPFKVVAYAHFVSYDGNTESSFVLPYLYDDLGVSLSLEKMHAYDCFLFDEALGKVIFADYIYSEDVKDFYSLYCHVESIYNPDDAVLSYDEYCQLFERYGLKIID